MTPESATQDRIRELFMEVGEHYKGRQKAEYKLYENKGDVHALYVLAADKARAVHVKGCTGMSSSEEVHLRARLVDYRRMAAAIEPRGIALLDDSSMLYRVLNNFGMVGIKISYDSTILRAKLEQNVPELR